MTWPTITGTRLGDWIYQNDQYLSKHQGWKIHVTARPSNSAVRIISNVCRQNQVAVKFLPSRADFDGQTEEQRGKWCAIYPTSTLHAITIASELSTALSRGACKRMRARERPPYDLYVCKYIAVRYGPYVNDMLINDHNQLVVDAWKKVTYRPPWVVDPWVNFNALVTPGSRQAVNLGKAFPEFRLR